jgi:hypothetical protein
MGLAEKRAELEKQRVAIADEKKARSDAEEERLIDEFGVGLVDGSFVLVKLPDSPASMPGHYVGCRPAGPAVKRFTETMWRDSNQRGVLDAKASAGADLARLCLKYPEPERYAALVAAYAAAPDIIAEALIHAARAGAAAEGKG